MFLQLIEFINIAAKLELITRDEYDKSIASLQSQVRVLLNLPAVKPAS